MKLKVQVEEEIDLDSLKPYKEFHDIDVLPDCIFVLLLTLLDSAVDSLIAQEVDRKLIAEALKMLDEGHFIRYLKDEILRKNSKEGEIDDGTATT